MVEWLEQMVLISGQTLHYDGPGSNLASGHDLFELRN